MALGCLFFRLLFCVSVTLPLEQGEENRMNTKSIITWTVVDVPNAEEGVPSVAILFLHRTGRVLCSRWSPDSYASHTEELLVRVGEVLDHIVEDVCEGDHSEGPDVPAKCTQRHNDLERAKGAGWFASHCLWCRGAGNSETVDLAGVQVVTT